MSKPTRTSELPPPELPPGFAAPSSLLTAAPAASGHAYPTERRNPASRQELLRRIAMEYREMPAMRLTVAQAQRLFGLRQDICVRVLDTLVNSGILARDANGRVCTPRAPASTVASRTRIGADPADTARLAGPLTVPRA